MDNLANKLLLALYPPGLVPFQLSMSQKAILESGELTTPPDVQRNLVLMEKAMNAEIENRVWRKPTFLSLRQLIVTGNSLEQMMDDNTIRIFRLDQYVVARDTQGVVLELILREMVSENNLDETYREHVTTNQKSSEGKFPIYTWCKRQPDGTYEIHQEIGEEEIPGRQKRKTLPFNVLRWTEVVGESYGRSKCDDHLPDLRAVDGFTKSMLDGGAMASRNINLVRPTAHGGLNLRRKLAKAENGDYLVGNPDDVTMLSFGNLPSLQYVAAELAGYKQELGAAFLMNSSVQRDAERVTMYEVRKLTEELEGTLGGVYTLLSVEMQGARVNRLFLQMQAQQKLPTVPEGVLEPVILTGLQSLGREQDRQRVQDAFLLIQAVPPEEQARVKWGNLLTKGFNAINLPDSVYSDDEFKEIQAQKQQQAMQANALNAGAQAAATTAGQGMAAAATQQEQ